LSLFLAACNGQTNGAPAAIQAYLQALVEKNYELISTLSCAAWEADARTELESFTAVTVTLDDLSCDEAGKDGEISLVECTGIVRANYGNEILEIDLSERIFQAVFEAGDWRMCGYR
jgi:hypothetical protein